MNKEGVVGWERAQGSCRADAARAPATEGEGEADSDDDRLDDGESLPDADTDDVLLGVVLLEGVIDGVTAKQTGGGG